MAAHLCVIALAFAGLGRAMPAADSPSKTVVIAVTSELIPIAASAAPSAAITQSVTTSASIQPAQPAPPSSTLTTTSTSFTTVYPSSATQLADLAGKSSDSDVITSRLAVYGNSTGPIVTFAATATSLSSSLANSAQTTLPVEDGTEGSPATASIVPSTDRITVWPRRHHRRL